MIGASIDYDLTILNDSSHSVITCHLKVCYRFEAGCYLRKT